MAKTKGPLFSLGASGTLAKTVVFSQWKGRSYVRKHKIPFNPKSTKQTNVRTAMTLLVPYWQSRTPSLKDSWNAFGKQFNMSGWNIFASRGMKEYIIQLGTDMTPGSVAVIGIPPAEVWEWVAV
ncbi:hypothetical protein ES703_55695 [subsurface metagenome]